jgi:hypothetical protein
MKKLELCIYLALTLILICSCNRNVSIEGKVTKSDSDSALTNVNITTDPPTSIIKSQPDGSFTFYDLDPKVYTITAIKEGFNAYSAKVEVKPGKAVQAQITMKRIVIVPESAKNPLPETNRSINNSEIPNRAASRNSSNESGHSVAISEIQSRDPSTTSSNELNLSGKYSGKLYQIDYNNPSNEVEFDYSIELQRSSGNKYSGTSKIIIDTDYGIFRLSAVLNNSVLTLTEEKVIGERRSKYPYWCIKRAELDVTNNNGTIILSGKWSSDSYTCNPGRIELRKGI